MKKAQDDGLRFITDADARPTGGAHALAHLWDNGKSAADELEVESIIAKGNSNRKVGRTNMNAVSSRSHMITIINITQTNTIDKMLPQARN